MDKAQEDLFRRLFPRKETPSTQKYSGHLVVGRSLVGTAKNRLTGETRAVKTGITTLENLQDIGDKCTGPCHCSVEIDGHCSKGWPSRSKALGLS